jgi:CPA1 family monovalent cation:H+ antiporter
MFDTAFVLLVIAALLVVVGFCQPLAAYLKLPPPVLLGVVGVALGAFPVALSRLGWSTGSDPFADIFVELPVSSATFIYVFLPLLVFEAGIVTDVRRTLQDAAPILLLAIVATLITTGVIGLALWPLAGVSLVVCLLLGAVVATTDPAAVIAIFRDVGAPARLTRLVEGEALLNDASGDRAVRRFARNARQRAGAGYRLGATRILSVFHRRRRTRGACRPRAARGNSLGARRSPC